MIKKYGITIESKYRGASEYLRFPYLADLWETLTQRDDVYLVMEDEEIYVCADGSKGDYDTNEWVTGGSLYELMREYMKVYGEYYKDLDRDTYTVYDIKRVAHFIEDIITQVLIDMLYRGFILIESKDIREKIYREMYEVIKSECSKEITLKGAYNVVCEWLDSERFGFTGSNILLYVSEVMWAFNKEFGIEDKVKIKKRKVLKAMERRYKDIIAKRDMV